MPQKGRVNFYDTMSDILETHVSGYAARSRGKPLVSLRDEAVTDTACRLYHTSVCYRTGKESPVGKGRSALEQVAEYGDTNSTCHTGRSASASGEALDFESCAFFGCTGDQPGP